MRRPLLGLGLISGSSTLTGSILASGVSLASDGGTTDKMMAQWEKDDAVKKECLLKLTMREDEDSRFLRIADDIVNAPMEGGKNLSLYRVHYRRQKNKAARKSKRRNRKR